MTGPSERAAGPAGLTGPAAPPPAGGGRLAALDGLRGLAALAVVLYHFLARFGEAHWGVSLYPHGDVSARFPALLQFGRFGVYLFFAISGFVILMTLERCSGLVDFAVRRAARLWPAMLVCATLSTLVLNGSGVTTHYPGWERFAVTPLEYLSSLVFLPPDMVGGALGLGGDPRWVEGVYWTLWAEIRFYALVAVVFLLAGRHFVLAWLAVQLASAGLETVRMIDPGLATAQFKLALVLQPQNLCWFSMGMAAYLWRRGRPGAVPLAVLALYAIAAKDLVAWQEGGLVLHPGRAATYAAVLAIVAAVAGRVPMRPLASAPLVAVGLASYPLYLFHQGPGMVGFMYAERAGIAPWAAFALVFAAVVGVALLLHRLVERPGQRWLTGLGRRGLMRLEARWPALRFGGGARFGAAA
ncbi:Peptidoglycan/LPS O-acetylase OafA/YrhL, contains acyltransferase and SGNH-hydrolase domains [Limimaricola pyoseonensis]|uniref:Peptidoglycan/LPS O-acetylase OafA/YrhL, contains acyltransferase and SGNH-hydrolase domains n=1 Tax=Limimaricola pyoseonensis TaxID=521013 RepID=A0A1G7J2Y4_9RHOB|nr:Peptidoglycan/LPS O-acetylase OafA/YrhL, contains acyltransferase and SGNH-hydrolase domains [Limimaricola pyoseonensis]